MDTLNQLLDNESKYNQAEGESFAIQWTPDIYTQETLNIGVCFKDNATGELTPKILDYFEKIHCLYGKDAEFNLKLACEVATELLNKADIKDIGVLTRQINCVSTGYAQGVSTNDILERLYSDLVPLGRRPNKLTGKRFNPTTRDSLYKRLVPTLKQSLDLDYAKHVPEDPYQQFNLPMGKKTVYLPFKKDGGIATLISTAYSDFFKVKSNLFDGYQDVDIASTKIQCDKNAVFILMPSADALLNRRLANKIENHVDEFVWQMKRHKIRVEPHTEQAELATYISEWCLAV